MTGASQVLDLSVQQTMLLKQAVRSKLKELDSYVDDSLNEYVMVLLANRHCQEKVMSELEDFLSPMLVEGFVQWLFSKCEELRKYVEPTREMNVCPKSDTPTTTTTTGNTLLRERKVSAEGGGNQRIFETALKSVTVNKMDIKSNRNGNGNEDVYQSRSQRFGSTKSGTRETRTRRRSRSPQSQKRRSRSPQLLRYQSIHSRLEDTLEGGSRQFDRQRSSKVSEHILDARELISSSRQRGTHRVIRRLEEGSKSVEPEANRVAATENSPEMTEEKKIRCTYWPNCKAGESCPFAHPSEPCKHFPSCSFGDKCIYIHPVIPCKFQDRCQNPNCNYQHSSPAGLLLGNPFTISNNPYHPPSAIPCRFYPNCKNNSCPFLHPSTAVCKFGENCQRPACPFSHPTNRILACKAFVNAPCRYGKNCTKLDCPFQHAASPTQSSNEKLLPLVEVSRSEQVPFPTQQQPQQQQQQTVSQSDA